ncbi:Cytosol aminopeptidase family, N-terminal domain [Mucilaginibacter gossypiicola]|uniref:Cytosol aminopeptidase family, N-terminal domain n=1 Tax=Mucilaginibacter gossypiicola TaxID=551995 RepID=A0A1H8QPX2_9SPHI|nr:M17 family peptidase N-terminal domain-containing protein [Mucilaginibacter gossypiicola]SEO56041.1 Cytosol aminopeptidase family, N-terminal domain [Mucilaginibacter gossypiicola]
MERTITTTKKTAIKSHVNLLRLFIAIVVIILTSFTNSWAQTNASALPKSGTSAVLGQIDGINIATAVQSPSNQQTPLQVICVFEYTEGDIFNSPPALPRNLNGLVHIDDALKGILTELRKSGRFEGRALETILITSPAGSMPAEKLLIIGLGDRRAFNPELMTCVGRVEMREALRLGVSSYSHASDLKDAGIDSPTGAVAVNVIKGATNAYETELFLKGHSLSSAKPITQITLLAGPAFFQTTADAVKAFVSTAKGN